MAVISGADRSVTVTVGRIVAVIVGEICIVIDSGETGSATAGTWRPHPNRNVEKQNNKRLKRLKGCME
jgi:hypothetical protein